MFRNPILKWAGLYWIEHNYLSGDSPACDQLHFSCYNTFCCPNTTSKRMQCIPLHSPHVAVLRQLRTAADEQWGQPGTYGDKSSLHCGQNRARNRNKFEARAVGWSHELDAETSTCCLPDHMTFSLWHWPSKSYFPKCCKLYQERINLADLYLSISTSVT